MESLNWSKIRALQSAPSLSALNVSFCRVAEGLERASGKVDLFQLSDTVFAAVGWRWAYSIESHDIVDCFFWSPSVSNILKGVYGMPDQPPVECPDPPSELLFENNSSDYLPLLAYLKTNQIEHSVGAVVSREPGRFAYVGRRISVGRFDYYFTGQEEEWIESAGWSGSRAGVIGVQCDDSRWAPLAGYE